MSQPNAGGGSDVNRREPCSSLPAAAEAPVPGETIEAAAIGPPARAPARPGADVPHIGPYRLLEKVGEGGMGVIYKAEQREPVRRIVALKVIKLGMDTKEVLARFEAERQALALMAHPNIARVLDAGMTEQGRPYFAMEHVAGVPLATYCDENRLTTRQRLELFIPVCHAVQHAHQKGIIHRDLKPSNILVTLVDGQPVAKVIDFGIAKAMNHRLAQHTLYTHAGALIGTPEYMSPEQAMTGGLDVDTRTDVYSLGVILYELLTGTLPFDSQKLRGAGREGMARIIRETEPQKPSTRLTAVPEPEAGAGKYAPRSRHRADPRTLRRELRGDLDWIVLKALEKDRTRRYETANALATDLRRHLDSEPVLARPPSTSYRLSKFAQKHKVGVTASAAVLATLLLGIVGTVAGLVRAQRQRDLAVLARADEQRQRVAAERARDEANAANRFLRDISASFGDIHAARRNLDAAAQRLDSGWLKDQPDLQASCRTAIAYYYLSFRVPAEAERQLALALAARRLPDGTYPADAAPIHRGIGYLQTMKRDYAAAERHQREALAAYRLLPDSLGGVADTLYALASLRDNQSDPAAARKLRLEALAVSATAAGARISARPHDARPYLDRGTYGLRLGQFREALADLKEAAERDPEDHWPLYVTACLQAYLEDTEAHRDTCLQLLRRWGASDIPYIGERVAKAALLSPTPPADVGRLVSLTDRAVASGGPRDLLPWFQLSKSLAEYRAGRYASAIEWADKARDVNSHHDQAILDLILAMSHHRLGGGQLAREHFDRATSRLDQHVRKAGEDDLGSGVENYLICQTLRREAEAMLTTTTPATRPGGESRG